MHRGAMGAALWLLLLLAIPAAAHGDGSGPGPDQGRDLGRDLGWYGSVYGGWLTEEGYREWFAGEPRMEEHYMLAGSVIRELRQFGDFMVEAEGMGAWHWGPFRGVDEEYAEAAASGNLRWKDMPWDGTVDTSLAFGLGLSATTVTPEHEERIHGRSDNALVYMMTEITAARPSEPDHMLFFRVHHRSGAFGLLSDIKGASNYLTVGVRVRLD